MICSQRGHFAVGCFQKNKNEDHKNQKYSQNRNIKSRAVYEVERKQAANYEDEESDDDCVNVGQLVEIDEVKEAQLKVKNWFHQVKINNQEVNFKIDSGAEINVIPYEEVEKLNKVDKIINRKSKVVAFGGYQLNVEGAIKLVCQPKNRLKVNIEFVVIKGVTPILGLSTCIELGLIYQISNIDCVDKQKNQFIANNQNVFEGLGKLPYKYKIRLQDGAVPVVKPVRRVPEVVKDKLNVVLCRLEKKNIIQKVTKPTDWVHDLVIVEKKDGSLRICLNPLELNKVIKREHYPIPKIEEIVHGLAGKKIYTVLDMKDGFHQIVLEEESSYICTFNTPWGRYRYKRLPFGLASSPEICQRENVRIFGDIPGVSVYFDDLIIAAEDEIEHDKLVNMVLSRAKQNGVKFNAEKTQYKVKTVKYLGFIFTKDGVTPDVKQIESISKLSTPKNKKAVQRFLGMLNFLHNFIPNMSTESYPLRQLLNKESEFEWGEIHQQSFEKLKNLVIEAQALTYFDNKKLITIQSDASLTGLGACLLQDGRPVAFASRSLNKTEQNYPIIERELLGIVFACAKFHNFIYGHKIRIETDHKPLVSILNKDIHKSTARIQRMYLKLMIYSFEISYIPGAQMYIADMLSRASIENDGYEDVKLDEDVIHVISIHEYLPMSEMKVKEFQLETAKDKVLSEVLRHINEGWTKPVIGETRHFLKLKDELFVKEGLIFKGDKVVVPSILRQEMLKLIHKGHSGIVKSKAKARRLLYWCNMGEDIEKVVNSCQDCAKFQRSNVKEPLIPHLVPKLPFHKVAMDICECRAVTYLVIVDYFSKWIDIVKLKTKTAKEVTAKCIEVFSVHGIPKYVVCDINPFNSIELKTFAEEYNFSLIHSSPYYPRSNGLAEKAVGIAKNIIKKSNNDVEIYEGLLEYRATPVAGTEYSPSQILMGRNLRTKLPISKQMLQPKVVVEDAHKALMEKVSATKNYHDRSAKEKQSHNVGDNVLVQNQLNKQWFPAEIVGKGDDSRSYVVKNQNDKLCRRNSNHLRSTLVKPKFEGIPVEFNETTSKQEIGSETLRVSAEHTSVYQTRAGRTIKPPQRLDL